MVQIECSLWRFSVSDFTISNNHCNVSAGDVEWHGPNNVEAFGNETYFYITDPTAVIEFCYWVEGGSQIVGGLIPMCRDIVISNDPYCPPSPEAQCNSTISYCELFNCVGNNTYKLQRLESIRLIDKNTGECFYIDEHNNPYGDFRFPYIIYFDPACQHQGSTIFDLIQHDFPQYLIHSGHTGNIGAYYYEMNEIQHLAAQTGESICKIKYRLLNSDLTMYSWTTRAIAYTYNCNRIGPCGFHTTFSELNNCYPNFNCDYAHLNYENNDYDNLEYLQSEKIEFRNSDNNDFNVYPIVSFDFINIEYANNLNIENGIITKITNVNGRKIDEFRINTTQFTYNISNLSPGMYFIIFDDTQNNRKIIKKFIKL